MTEEWRDIDGYKGLYQVSNIGNVKSLPREKRGKGDGVLKVDERILKPNPTSRKTAIHNTEYLTVCLSKEGQKKTFLLHRLVAKAFVDNPDNKPHVNHKNGNGFDNRVNNLEWVTNAENINHAWKIGLMSDDTRRVMSEKAKRRLGKLNSCWRGYVNVCFDGELIEQFETLKDAEQWIRENTVYTKASKGNISMACTGKIKKIYGYVFEYTKEKMI